MESENLGTNASGKHLLFISIGAQSNDAPINWLFGNQYGVEPLAKVAPNPLGIKKGYYYGDLFMFVLPDASLMSIGDEEMIMPNKTMYIEAFIRSMIPAAKMEEHFKNDPGCNRDKLRFQWMVASLDELFGDVAEPAEMVNLVGTSGGGQLGG